ncbi:MaoC family dehydratase [Nocardioides sp.]|uniref:MaoC family dehydratase n=1 Tax=Nocardioides sp. TaxID=35761 RepID=UPI003D09D570
MLDLVRAALPSVPVVNRLPGVRKTGDGTLPDTIRRRQATVVRSEVASYADVCGFPERDTAPLTFLHVLAFPLHLEIMTDRAFPFPAIGTVHLGNSITQHRRVAIGEGVGVSASAVRLREHPKGRLFDVDVTVTASGDTVWESTSTYLRLGSGHPEVGAEPVFETVPAGGIPWRLPADLGRRYAAVSGDHNPIHLYPLTARALGFRRQIAHGMWSLARCVAAVENRLPAGVRVEVGFRKPIFLPGTVSIGVQESDHGLAFSLTSVSSGAPHLLGRATYVD